MLTLTWRNLLFRKVRATLTILGLSASIMLVVILAATMRETERKLTDSLGQMAGQIRIQAKSDALSGQSINTVPAGSLLGAADIERVLASATGYDALASSPMVVEQLVAPVFPNSPPKVRLAGVVPGHEAAALIAVPLAAGQGHLAGAADAILGAGAHTYLSKQAGHELAVGEEITLPGMPGRFVLRGIAARRDAMTDSLVVIPLATAQRALKRGETANMVVLTYGVDHVKEAAAALKQQLSDLDVVTADAMLASVEQALTGQRTFFRLINGVVYFTAIAIIFMVMYTSVMERTREIGTLRAVGVARGAVIGAVLLEAMLFALVGAGIAWLAAALYLPSWGFAVRFGDGLQTMAGALLIAILSSLIPAARAARVDPLEALRYE